MPYFITHNVQVLIRVNEGGHAHFKCRVSDLGDNHVIWYKTNKGRSKYHSINIRYLHIILIELLLLLLHVLLLYILLLVVVVVLLLLS